MKFQTRYDKCPDISQSFDKEKISIKRCGKEINCYDAIQTANVDTNIYDVMKKYGCQENEAIEFMKEHGGEKGIYADITALQKEIHDISDIYEVKRKADLLFNNLPLEVKEKYGKDLNVFLEEQKKKAQAAQTEPTGTEPKETEPTGTEPKE